MHRQSSRNTANMDTIDCIVNTNDLALENEVVKRVDDHRSKSRRDQPVKRSNENPVHRSTHRSPPSATRKRHQSPIPIPSSSLSRPHHHYYSTQRHHRVSSPSLSPPPPPPLSQSSSRHHRPTRPVVSEKRPHPQSESPSERRPTHRYRPELPAERTIGDVLTSIPSKEEPKTNPKQETVDLSFISEDESTKTHYNRSNSIKTNESSSITNNNKLHSTPSLPILQTNPNESILEISTIPQECDLSIFAKSNLSTENTSLILTPSINPTNDFMQTIDLISKYRTMQTTPNTNPQVEALSKQIWIIIQKQIELQKFELACREREIKLRERELAEREKRFNVKSTEPISNIISVNSEPLLITKPNIIEENTQPKSEILIDQDIINVSPEGSVPKSIPSTVDTFKVKLTNKTGSDQPSVTRKSRFSQLTVDPSIFSSQQTSVVDLYSDDLDAPNELIPSAIATDLKITSSSTCRKVEIQSGNTDKTTTSKGSVHDLRLTLSKNRPKPQNNDEHGVNGNQTVNDHESTIKNNDNKQQSYDYQQQRSVTSIETIIDDTNDKRDVRRHRQQQYPSSANNNVNERSYTHGATSKYGSNQKRYETDDLRSRLFEQKQPKSSRTTHKNNY